MKRLLFSVLVLVVAVTAAQAATIEVLWYSGGVSNDGGTEYQDDINNVLVPAALANTAMNTWNVTFWDGGAIPAGTYDVLVTASHTGGWVTFPSYTALTTAAPAFGDRIMVTGQDADFHFLNSPGHQTTFDSSLGFLIDAINWAGSGTGMGAVLLDLEGAVLSSLLGSLATDLGTEFGGGESVIIPAAFATFPINEDLTSAGLSNWSTSSHSSWSGWDTTVWTGINELGTTGRAVTLVSADTAGGGTGGIIPEPGTFALLGLGLVGLAVARRRRSS